MKTKTNKIGLYLKSHCPLFIIIILFSFISLPLCFINNDYLSLVEAEHIDSGSILNSIFQLFDTTKINLFYNQNIPYHTAYGYPYNSIIFLIFFVYKLFKLDFINNFYIFATSAKLLNFFIGNIILVQLYYVSKKIFKSRIQLFLVLLFTAIFPPYILYSYHIKSDLLGTLFIVLSIKYIYRYLENGKLYDVVTANIFGGLSILCKQPYIFVLIPLFLIFFKNFNITKSKVYINTYLKSLIIFFLIFFIIHPYAFLDIKGFIVKQNYLIVANASTTIIENIKQWFLIYIHEPYLLIMFLSPLIFAILYNLKSNKKNIESIFLYYVSLFLLTYQLWTIIKVGPVRVNAYFIPIFSLSLIVLFHLLNQYINKKNLIFNIINKTFFIIIFLYIAILMARSTFTYTNNSYKFKSTFQYLSIKLLSGSNISEINNKRIIYSVSIPLQVQKFKDSKNTWQFDEKGSLEKYQPELILIDFTVYWEKPYEYWKNVSESFGLKKEKILITNQTNKSIVLFYN